MCPRTSCRIELFVNKSARDQDAHEENLKTVTQSALTPRCVDVFTVAGPQGEWETPAISRVSLGVTLSNHSSKWRESSGVCSADLIVGDISLCERGRSRTYTLDRPANFGVIILSDETMSEACLETKSRAPEIQTVPLARDAQLTRLSQTLIHEGLCNFENGSLFADSLATGLAVYLANNYSARPSQISSFAGGLAPALLRKSLDYMQASLNRNIRLSDLAEVVGMSRSHYIRSFRQSMGFTPHQYLLNQRIKQAQELIRQRMTSLADVALACGFSDQHHLSRIFRQVTGITPTMFRRSL